MDGGSGGGGEESESASSEKGGKIKKTSSFLAELTGVKSTKRMQVRMEVTRDDGNLDARSHL